MYAQHYGFSGMPFQLTPDHRFFFGSSVHNRAIAHLIYGLAQEEGFIVVTGEVGAGKTTLVEQLWSQLDRNTYTIARIVTTQVSSDDLLRLTLAGFGIDEQGDKSTLLRRLERMLKEERAIGRRCLLVVDEVQSLSTPALEELRMLSNMTEGGRVSLQTILLGQPQFRRTLASPDLDQLRQRVLASFHLGPLGPEEVRAYVQHRLRAVGWTGNPHFEEAAYAAVHRHSGGIPRRINRLCSRVLLYGALEEATRDHRRDGGDDGRRARERPRRRSGPDAPHRHGRTERPRQRRRCGAGATRHGAGARRSRSASASCSACWKW